MLSSEEKESLYKEIDESTKKGPLRHALEVGSGGIAGVGVNAMENAKRKEDINQVVSMMDHSTDSPNYEYKTISTNFLTSFGNPQILQKVTNEQSKYGWQLDEKFNNTRLSLKRPISDREKDSSIGGDPYQSWYGTPPWVNNLIVLGTIALILALCLLMINLSALIPRT